jgi:hypothetical protein
MPLPLVPNWSAGNMIPPGRDKTLRVIESQPGSDEAEDRVLVVEPV